MRLRGSDVDIDHAKWLPGQGEEADRIRGTGRCLVCRTRMVDAGGEWVGIVTRRRGREDSNPKVCESCLIEGGMLQWLAKSQ